MTSIVKSEPEIIKNAMTDNEDGTVTIKLYDLLTVQPRYIKVDKTIPDLPSVCAILGKECLWVELIIKALMAIGWAERACTKAYSKMKYKHMEGSLMHSLLKMITGKDCSNYNDIDILKK